MRLGWRIFCCVLLSTTTLYVSPLVVSVARILSMRSGSCLLEPLGYGSSLPYQCVAAIWEESVQWVCCSHQTQRLSQSSSTFLQHGVAEVWRSCPKAAAPRNDSPGHNIIANQHPTDIERTLSRAQKHDPQHLPHPEQSHSGRCDPSHASTGGRSWTFLMGCAVTWEWFLQQVHGRELCLHPRSMSSPANNLRDHLRVCNGACGIVY